MRKSLSWEKKFCHSNKFYPTWGSSVTIQWQCGSNGNTVVHINEVTVCQAGSVLRWATVCSYTILIFNQDTHNNSAWPSLRGKVQWVLAMVTATAREEMLSSVQQQQQTLLSGLLAHWSSWLQCWVLMELGYKLSKLAEKEITYKRASKKSCGAKVSLNTALLLMR